MSESTWRADLTAAVLKYVSRALSSVHGGPSKRGVKDMFKVDFERMFSIVFFREIKMVNVR